MELQHGGGSSTEMPMQLLFSSKGTSNIIIWICKISDNFFSLILQSFILGSFSLVPALQSDWFRSTMSIWGGISDRYQSSAGLGSRPVASLRIGHYISGLVFYASTPICNLENASAFITAQEYAHMWERKMRED